MDSPALLPFRTVQHVPRQEYDLRDNWIVRGDSLKVLRDLPDESIDLVFADPPYFMQLQNELRRPDESLVDPVDDAWDQFSGFREYDSFCREWLVQCRRVLKPRGTLWVIGTYHNIYRLGYLLQDLGFWMLNSVIWEKANPTPHFRGVRFCNAHEELIWAARSEREARGYTFNYQEMKTLNGGKQMRSVWHFPICSGGARKRAGDGKKLHTTEKPLALLDRIIRSSTKEGDMVLDPFAGTGTTGEAALRLGRRFFLIEQHPLYIQFGIEPRLCMAQLEMSATWAEEQQALAAAGAA